MEKNLNKIIDQLKYLIENNTKLKFAYKIELDDIIFIFQYFDKQGYKQTIIKYFDFENENIDPHKIINHLKEINPFYFV